LAVEPKVLLTAATCRDAVVRRVRGSKFSCGCALLRCGYSNTNQLVLVYAGTIFDFSTNDVDDCVRMQVRESNDPAKISGEFESIDSFCRCLLDTARALLTPHKDLEAERGG
jgi:hypothetical protein